MTSLQQDASAPHAGLSGSERRTLDSVFAHPIAHNLAWTDVVTLVRRIGTVEERSNQVFVLQIGAETLDTRKPHTKHLTTPQVIDLRHFMDRAGLSPAHGLEVAAVSDSSPPGVIVVVDHHEARVYHVDLDAEDSARHAISAYAPQHVLHEVTHKARSADHRAGADGNGAYYERIAGAVAKGGMIVVLGHGAGESNAGHELAKYLREHHPLTFRRIVREVVADLPALTPAELLRIAREAFSPYGGDPPNVESR